MRAARKISSAPTRKKINTSTGPIVGTTTLLYRDTPNSLTINSSSYGMIRRTLKRPPNFGPGVAGFGVACRFPVAPR